MNPAEGVASLYDDWRNRRSHLLEKPSSGGRWVEVQVKILDYLIRRYRHSPVAEKPARFALAAELVWDERRIVVHNHLWRGKVGGARTKDQAESRVRTIVHRMAAGEQDSAGAFVPEETPSPATYPLRVLPIWRSIRRCIAHGSDADEEIELALAVCPLLPTEVISHLVSRASDTASEDAAAAELLLQCGSRSALASILRVWRERVAHCPPNDGIRECLEGALEWPENREAAAELMRELLADGDADVRIAAACWIARLGDLDDIGLLSDLMPFAESGDDEREGRALVDAMTAISRSGAGR